MTSAPALGAPGTPVIITGGASGIGLASAEALAAVGRGVALWDINGDAAKSAADNLARTYGVTAVGVRVDLRDPQAVGPTLAATREIIGKPGGLVHAAGTVDTDSIDGMTVESWDAGIAIHLRSLALIVQAIREDLASQPGSAIVAIASINATLGNAMNPIYTAAKGGMLSLVRSLADRLARDGIRINSVSPGQIVTPMMRPALEAMPGFFEKRILLERIGEPMEVARAVRFLLSEEASYITAAQLVVDGGNISSQRC
jgi:NAD(P)-dependent dehydrogenase (short-subunit alcohol dehydrogenase family)